MKSITFTITAEEVRSLSEKKLSDEQVQETLESVENDQVLWSQIQGSIKSAIDSSLISKWKHDRFR